MSQFWRRRLGEHLRRGGGVGFPGASAFEDGAQPLRHRFVGDFAVERGEDVLAVSLSVKKCADAAVDRASIGGGLAAGGISNLYYPASDRSGVEVTFANTLIGTAEGALQNLAQEFIVRKLTPRLPVYSSMGTK